MVKKTKEKFPYSYSYSYISNLNNRLFYGMGRMDFTIKINKSNFIESMDLIRKWIAKENDCSEKEYHKTIILNFQLLEDK
jgi:hypothetical protein